MGKAKQLGTQVREAEVIDLAEYREGRLADVPWGERRMPAGEREAVLQLGRVLRNGDLVAADSRGKIVTRWADRFWMVESLEESLEELAKAATTAWRAVTARRARDAAWQRRRRSGETA